MNKKRLFWHFSLYLLITLLALLAATLFSADEVRSFYEERTRQDLKARAMLVDDQFLSLFIDNKWPELNSLCKQLGSKSITRFTVIKADGRVVADSDENPARLDNHGERPEILSALAGVTGTSIRFSYTLQQNLIYVAIPLRNPNGAIIGSLRLSVPTTAIDQTLATLQNKIALGSLAVAFLIAGITLFISRRISRPLQDMVAGAGRFAGGDFSEEIPLVGPYEMVALAGALNRMARDLNKQIQTVVSQRNELEAIFDSMVDGILTVDQSERITALNGATARLLETTLKRQAIGRTILEVVRNSEFNRFIQASLKADAPLEQELVLTHSQLGDRIIHALSVQIKDQGEQILVVLHDVTRLKELENLRRDFVANVSHELRTPITAIQGFVETLLDGAMEEPENRGKFLKIIEKQSDRLKSIVEDLLTLSRIEEQKRAIIMQPTPLLEVLSSAIEVCQPRADEQGIMVKLDCPADLEATINAPLLELATVNLIDNAIKYSGTARINISASLSPEHIAITVADLGEGIPLEHQHRLFERFYRVDKARSRKQGGTGLGLAIVKHIVLSHHGHISLLSTPGKGSTFTILLPRPSTGSAIGS
ncbi:MAG: HAMP domain-containing protein [Proteobacteria bacterium]|nr:HAMP domain-containing protein [Pseudomonadota bacterium]MBU1640868.1 HAMP domain-containing protein [Pseudomonadota bacterium]